MELIASWDPKGTLELLHIGIIPEDLLCSEISPRDGRGWSAVNTRLPAFGRHMPVIGN